MKKKTYLIQTVIIMSHLERCGYCYAPKEYFFKNKCRQIFMTDENAELAEVLYVQDEDQIFTVLQRGDE